MEEQRVEAGERGALGDHGRRLSLRLLAVQLIAVVERRLVALDGQLTVHSRILWKRAKSAPFYHLPVNCFLPEVMSGL